MYRAKIVGLYDTGFNNEKMFLLGILLYGGPNGENGHLAIGQMTSYPREIFKSFSFFLIYFSRGNFGETFGYR